jgi:hypothetical protein
VEVGDLLGVEVGDLDLESRKWDSAAKEVTAILKGSAAKEVMVIQKDLAAEEDLVVRSIMEVGRDSVVEVKDLEADLAGSA